MDWELWVRWSDVLLGMVGVTVCAEHVVLEAVTVGVCSWLCVFGVQGWLFLRL